MKLFIAKLQLAALVLALMLAAVIPVYSQDAEPNKEELEATISTLQTQVADLDGQDVSTPAASAEWNTNAVAGNGYAVLSAAQPGTVDVIAAGTYDGQRLPFVIHNNMDTAVDRVSVSGSVLDETGALFATGGDHGVSPGWIESHGIGIGYLYFDGIAFPAGAKVEMVVSYEAAETRDGFGSLEATVAEWNQVEDRIVGFLTNPHATVIGGPISVYVVCLAEDGSVASFSDDFTDSETIPVGGRIPFQVTLDPPSCDYVLVVADGWSF